MNNTRGTTVRGRTGWLGWGLLAAGVLVMALAASPWRGGSAFSAHPEAWHTELQAALPIAASSGKPLLLDFTADWCGPCQWMNRNVFARADVRTLIETNFVPVKVDMTTPRPNGELAQRMRIEGFPTFIVLTPEGAEVARILGGREPEAFTSWLNGALERARPPAAG